MRNVNVVMDSKIPFESVRHTVGHFARHVDDIAGFQSQFVRLQSGVRMTSGDLRTVPLFVEFLVGILRRWRFDGLQPALAIGFRGARKDLARYVGGG